ncbi:MAG: site-2 protease family protein, partial [Clostridia bacterium]|nr:site-2 protease family protein [Clostridia bacterium]
VELERDGRRLAVVVVPRLGEGGRGQLGILPVMEVERLKPLHAIWEGIASTGRIVGQWFGALALMVRGAEGPEVLGPVGIGQQIGQATRMGLSYLLSLAGIISANLGLVNLLPIPALDGSRLVFLLLEGVRGRPVDPAKENLVHFVGFALLMLLTLAITYRDVARLGFG